MQSEMEWGQGRIGKEIFRVPACFTQGQNTRMSCTYASADECNTLPVYLWEAVSASYKSLGNSRYVEVNGKGVRTNNNNKKGYWFWVRERY